MEAAGMRMRTGRVRTLFAVIAVVAIFCGLEGMRKRSQRFAKNAAECQELEADFLFRVGVADEGMAFRQKQAHADPNSGYAKSSWLGGQTNGTRPCASHHIANDEKSNTNVLQSSPGGFFQTINPCPIENCRFHRPF